MQDPNHVCDLHHTHGNTASLSHWGRPGIKPTSSWIPVSFISHWAMTGTLQKMSFLLSFIFTLLIWQMSDTLFVFQRQSILKTCIMEDLLLQKKKIFNYICKLFIHIKWAHFIKTSGMQKSTIYQIANLAFEKEKKIFFVFFFRAAHAVPRLWV